nr:transcription factor prr1 [Quercus suber]
MPALRVQPGAPSGSVRHRPKQPSTLYCVRMTPDVMSSASHSSLDAIPVIGAITTASPPAAEDHNYSTLESRERCAIELRYVMYSLYSRDDAQIGHDEATGRQDMHVSLWTVPTACMETGERWAAAVGPRWRGRRITLHLVWSPSPDRTRWRHSSQPGHDPPPTSTLSDHLPLLGSGQATVLAPSLCFPFFFLSPCSPPRCVLHRWMAMHLYRSTLRPRFVSLAPPRPRSRVKHARCSGTAPDSLPGGPQHMSSSHSILSLLFPPSSIPLLRRRRCRRRRRRIVFLERDSLAPPYLARKSRSVVHRRLSVYFPPRPACATVHLLPLVAAADPPICSDLGSGGFWGTSWLRALSTVPRCCSTLRRISDTISACRARPHPQPCAVGPASNPHHPSLPSPQRDRRSIRRPPHRPSADHVLPSWTAPRRPTARATLCVCVPALTLDPPFMGPVALTFFRRMLENPQDESVVRWGNEGDSFVVLEAWEFKHPDFKMNNKDALDNIRRKAPAPRKPNAMLDEMIPTQQMDLVNTQLVATQQQLQQLQERYNELSVHHSMLLQELIGVQKTVVNHEHVMQYVMNFLNSVDAQRRRESRVVNPFASHNGPNGTAVSANDSTIPLDEDIPASPLQHASKLLSEVNADHLLNTRNLELMTESHARFNPALTTPPPDVTMRNGTRSTSRGDVPNSATSSGAASYGDLENMVYPIGATQGIDPTYSEHVHNIPYPMPTKTPDGATQPPAAGRKKSHSVDPGWVRPPQIMLVEDDQTCRRIGGKFLYAFHCAIDNALDGLEAVNKMNAGAKYDLVLMDIIMPNLDGVSATHLIRQFDNTPIVAMTSNIRSDDISMYFAHGLLNMLEKHLSHLKKHPPGLDTESMGAPPLVPGGRRSLKEDDSPLNSPAGLSGWNSPANMPSISPASTHTEDPYMQAVHNNAGSNPYQQTIPPQPAYNQRGPQGSLPQHRRQISDISGGASEVGGDSKRQQMYAPQAMGAPMQQNMPQMPRPPR